MWPATDYTLRFIIYDILSVLVKKIDFKKDDLSGLLTKKGKNKKNKDDWIDTFEGYMNKFGTEVQKFPLPNSLIHTCIWEITA